MRRKSLDKIIIEHLPFIDIPMLMFAGCGLGFLLIGVFYTVFAVFIGNEYTPWTRILFTGLIDIGISALIGGIALVYWKLVLSKSGVIFPALSGFGLILVLMVIFSAMALGVQTL